MGTPHLILSDRRLPTLPALAPSCSSWEPLGARSLPWARLGWGHLRGFSLPVGCLWQGPPLIPGPAYRPVPLRGLPLLPPPTVHHQRWAGGTGPRQRCRGWPGEAGPPDSASPRLPPASPAVTAWSLRSSQRRRGSLSQNEVNGTIRGQFLNCRFDPFGSLLIILLRKEMQVHYYNELWAKYSPSRTSSSDSLESGPGSERPPTPLRANWPGVFRPVLFVPILIH